MPHSTIAQTRHCRGFSLLELAAVLALLSGLVFALMYKTTDVSIQTALQSTDSALTAADEQLRQFAAWNGRLPCPDTNGDGVENCDGGSQKGDLPYRTLGLAAIGYEVGEQGGRALRYGVYRNAAADADLAVRAERFKPTNADGTAYDLDNSNSLDFCTALATASGRAQSDAYLHVVYTDGARAGMAYMLASPGVADADNDADRHDGLNGKSTAAFNAPQTPVSTSYDDTTRGRGLAELHELLHCEVSQRSLNLAANAIALEEENIAFAKSNKDSADQGVFMNAVGTALTAWSMLQAAAGLSGAMEVQTISAGLLATATATCAVPPFVGCALVPVYTIAVASAGTGVTLSATALGFSAAALGLQVTSTALYTTIADKAGVPDTVDVGLGITQAMVDEAKADFDSANALAQTAESAYAQAFTNYESGTKADADASRGTLETEIAKLSSEQASNARDDLYGFPRPVDLDPDNPPGEDDRVIIGVEPAIDSWLDSVAMAERMAGVDLVDADGEPIKDEDGNEVDLGASAAAAKSAADDRIEEVHGSLVAAACGDDTSCGLSAAFDAHVAAYKAAREEWNQAEAERAKAEAARTKADSAYDAYGALNCAFTSGKGYDPESNVCTNDPPGSGASDAGTDSALCDASSAEVYDPDACEALKASQNANPVCDEDDETYYNADICASLETTSGPLTFFSGMDDLVRTLDSKGTVQ